MGANRSAIVMRKYLYSLLISAFLLVGCAKHDFSVPVIEKLEPQISAVSGQAKKTTSSAERTVEYAIVADTKFKGDKDTANTVRSAKETLGESRETEVQLAVLKEKGKRADDTAKEVTDKLTKQNKYLKDVEDENRTLKEKIKKMGETIAKQRWWIISMGLITLIAAALVIKPWRWA